MKQILKYIIAHLYGLSVFVAYVLMYIGLSGIIVSSELGGWHKLCWLGTTSFIWLLGVKYWFEK